MKTEACVIAVDIGGTRIRVALADESRVTATEAALWPPDLSPAEEVDFIADFALSLAAKLGKTGSVRAAGLWWDALAETFYAHLLNRGHRRVHLHKATLSETAGLVGAAGLAWRLVRAAT